MIRVVILQSSGVTVGFTCRGHADYAEAGQDIVCAGVSAIATCTLNGLTEVAKLPGEAALSEKDGIRFVLDASCGARETEKVALLLGTMELGLRQIEKDYPGSLKIVYREV